MLIAKITGAVSVAFGIAALVLAVWVLDQQLAIGHVVQISLAAAVVTLLAIAGFCCLAGYRLLFNRPNRYGLLLSRSAFRTLAFSFCAIVFVVANIASSRGNHGLLAGAVVLGLLGFGSTIAARTISLKGAISPVFRTGTSLLQTAMFVPPGFSCGLEIMNDNATPMAFVVEVLQEFARLSDKEAMRIMLEIHRRGGVLLPVASFEEATRIADAVTEKARANHHPLACRAVRIE